MNKLFHNLTTDKFLRTTLFVYFFFELIRQSYFLFINYQQSFGDVPSLIETSQPVQIIIIFVILYSLQKNKGLLNTNFEKILLILFFVSPLVPTTTPFSINSKETILSVFLIISFFTRHRVLFLIISILMSFYSIEMLLGVFSPNFYEFTPPPFLLTYQFIIIGGFVGFVTYFVVGLKLILTLVNSKFDGLGYFLLSGLSISIIGSFPLLMTFTFFPENFPTLEFLYPILMSLVLCTLTGQYLFLWGTRSINQSDISIIKENVHRGGKNLINIVKLTSLSILLPLLNYILIVVFEFYNVSQFIGLIGLIVSIIILYLLVTTSLLLINSVKSNSGDSIVFKTEKNFLNSEFKILSILILVNLVVFLIFKVFQLDIIDLSIPMGVITLITSIVLLFTFNNIGKKLMEI